MIERISQSFMKDMRAYLDEKGCGYLIEVKWVNGELLDDASESMKLGSYFEYITTGALPKSGIVPQPEYMVTPMKDVAKGKRTMESLTVDDMYVQYRLAHINSKRLLDYLNTMGLQIIKFAWHITKGRFDGTIDLVVKATKRIKFQSGFVIHPGTIFAIDLKYSGLIEDFRTVHGWAGMQLNGGHMQKDYHGIQARQYTYLAGMPVFFMVVSSKNEIDILFLRTVVSPESIEAHKIEGNRLMESLKYHAEVGLEPRPELSKCLECVLAGRCPHKLLFPHAVDVEL